MSRRITAIALRVNARSGKNDEFLYFLSIVRYGERFYDACLLLVELGDLGLPICRYEKAPLLGQFVFLFIDSGESVCKLRKRLRGLPISDFMSARWAICIERVERFPAVRTLSNFTVPNCLPAARHRARHASYYRTSAAGAKRGGLRQKFPTMTAIFRLELFHPARAPRPTLVSVSS